MSKVILVNITWNPNGWRDNNYINPKAGHKYVRDSVAGESLNFDFNKNGIDTEKFIYGYFKCTNQPISFEQGGLILFYTKNTDKNEGQIVGVYGNANVIDEERHDVDFQKERYYLNIEGERDLSLLFPVPIMSEPYKKVGQKRLVPQVGFTYKDEKFAKKIILEELKILEQKSMLNKDYEKLINLYEKFFKTKYVEQDSDEIEQNEIGKFLQMTSRKSLEEKFENLSLEEETEKILIKGKHYKRNNYNVSLIKEIRNYKCQICNGFILKKDGTKYVEAAHITPKYLKGKETPDNIMILCPNHHKEFDYGKVKIIHRDESEIEFEMNGKNHLINLAL